MTNNNIILLNDIILKIHTTEDFEEMRKIVLSFLKFLIPAFGNVFYLAPGAGADPYKLSDGVSIGLPNESMNIYLTEYQDYDKTTWSYTTPTAKAYNESAFIQSEAHQNSDFYRRVYAPSDIIYQVSLTIIHNGIFLGVIALFRTSEEEDFCQEDLFTLELLAAHLGVRLFRNLQTVSARQLQRPGLELLLSRYHLTLRETEILYALLNETAVDKICSSLCISPNTYKKHLLHLYKKFGVKNRLEFYQAINRL